MKKIFLLLNFSLLLLSSIAETRPFRMGFSTLLYAPTGEAIKNTVKFLKENGDMYTVKLDGPIPWRTLLDNQPLPAEFQKQVDEHVMYRFKDYKLQLVLTPLKDSYDGLVNDLDGSLPQETYNSPKIVDAYVKYCQVMIDALQPYYVLTGVNSNELYLRNPNAWKAYSKFSKAVITKLKADNRNILFAESISLNKLMNPEKPVKATKYKRDIINFARHFDFFPVTFHPYAAVRSTAKEYQEAFDFLHKNVRQKIAIAETIQLAQSAPVKDIVLQSNLQVQKDYIDVLFKNATRKKYLFVSYWFHRDCDVMVSTLPPAAQESARIIKDAGLIDENANHRPAYNAWKNVFSKTYRP